MKIYYSINFSLVLLVFQLNLNAQTIVEKNSSKLFSSGQSGQLIYTKDSLGNRLPDFSYAGYHSGERAIPLLPVRITLEPGTGDDTKRIQEALDKIGALVIDEKGHRGTLLLKRGIYRVEGMLSINNSGVVLRGEGSSTNGTVIIAAGYGDFEYKRTLITIGPESDHFEAHTSHRYIKVSDQVHLLADSRQDIVDEYVPVGSKSFTVNSASLYKPGDRIVVYRPSTKEWIQSIGCDQLEPRWAGIRDVRWIKKGDGAGFYYQRLGYDSQYSILMKAGENWNEFQKRIPLSEDGQKFDFTRQWEAGEYDFYFERRITGIDGNRITIDIPLVHSLDLTYGGGAVFLYESPGRITEVGIENLRLLSEFADPVAQYPLGDPEKMNEAELHAWNGIHLKSNTENSWVRNVTGNYFGWSLVSASGKRATIQDCVNLGHASKITGGRRYPFMVDGQMNLVQRCVTFEGRHEFVTQQKTAGPNVFVDCVGINSRSNAGPHHRYSVGTLFDNVKSENPMESRFRGNSGTGHGWAGTQTCFYNCIAPEFIVEAPPGGICWIIGSGTGDEKSTKVKPISLFYQQVMDRLGEDALDRLATHEQRKNLGNYLWVIDRLKNEDM